MTDLKENLEQYLNNTAKNYEKIIQLLTKCNLQSSTTENTDNTENIEDLESNGNMDSFQTKKEEMIEEIKAFLIQIPKLSEELSKNEIISDEDLENFDGTINDQQKEIDELKQKLEIAKKENTEISMKTTNIEIKNKMEIENLKDKIKVLNTSYEKERDRCENLLTKLNQTENTLSETKLSLNQINTKYCNLLDESEINNKNLKKNFALEKQVKEQAEELESLKTKLEHCEESQNFKTINEKLKQEINDLNKEIKVKESEISSLNKTIVKLKEENFNKFDKLNELENDNRVKKLKINELSYNNEKLSKKISELNLICEENDKQIKTFKSQNENRVKDLKSELESSIVKLKKIETENEELKKEIKNCDYVSGLARSSNQALTKKDFSILEIMSRRVEEMEIMNDNLKSQISLLSNQISKVELEKTRIEKNVFDFLKEEVRISNKEMNKIELSNDNDSINGFSLLNKNHSFSNEVLLESIINQKKENALLRQQLADITIEINKIMRQGQ